MLPLVRNFESFAAIFLSKVDMEKNCLVEWNSHRMRKRFQLIFFASEAQISVNTHAPHSSLFASLFVYYLVCLVLNCLCSIFQAKEPQTGLFSGLAINIFMTYLKLLNYGKIKTTTILNLDKSILMVPVASESLLHTGVIRIVYNILYCIHHQYLTRKYGDKK